MALKRLCLVGLLGLIVGVTIVSGFADFKPSPENDFISSKNAAAVAIGDVATIANVAATADFTSFLAATSKILGRILATEKFQYGAKVDQSLVTKYPNGIFVYGDDWFTAAGAQAAETDIPHGEGGIWIKYNKLGMFDVQAVKCIHASNDCAWDDVFPTDGPTKLALAPGNDNTAWAAGYLSTDYPAMAIRQQLILSHPPVAKADFPFTDEVIMTDDQIANLNGVTHNGAKGGGVLFSRSVADNDLYRLPAIIKVSAEKATQTSTPEFVYGPVFKFAFMDYGRIAEYANFIKNINSTWIATPPAGTIPSDEPIPLSMVPYCGAAVSTDIKTCLDRNPWLQLSVDVLSFMQSHRNQGIILQTLLLMSEQVMLSSVIPIAGTTPPLLLAADLTLGGTSKTLDGKPERDYAAVNFSGIQGTLDQEKWSFEYKSDTKIQTYLDAGTNYALNASTTLLPVGAAVEDGVQRAIGALKPEMDVSGIPVIADTFEFEADTFWGGKLGKLKIGLIASTTLGSHASIVFDVTARTVSPAVAVTLGLMEHTGEPDATAGVLTKTWLTPGNFQKVFMYGEVLIWTAKNAARTVLDQSVYLSKAGFCKINQALKTVASGHVYETKAVSSKVERLVRAGTADDDKAAYSSGKNLAVAMGQEMVCKEKGREQFFQGRMDMIDYTDISLGMQSRAINAMCTAHEDGVEKPFYLTVHAKDQAKPQCKEELTGIEAILPELQMGETRAASQAQAVFVDAATALPTDVSDMFWNPWYRDALVAGIEQAYKLTLLTQAMNVKTISAVAITGAGTTGTFVTNLGEFGDKTNAVAEGGTIVITGADTDSRDKIATGTYSAKFKTGSQQVQTVVPATAPTKGLPFNIVQTSSEGIYTVPGLYALSLGAAKEGVIPTPNPGAKYGSVVLATNATKLSSMLFKWTTSRFVDSDVEIKYQGAELSVTITPTKLDATKAATSFSGFEPLQELKISTFIAVAKVYAGIIDETQATTGGDVLTNVKYIDNAQQGLVYAASIARAIAAAPKLKRDSGNHVAVCGTCVFTETVVGTTSGIRMRREADSAGVKVQILFGNPETSDLDLVATYTEKKDLALQEFLKRSVKYDMILFDLFGTLELYAGTDVSTTISPSITERPTQNRVAMEFFEAMNNMTKTAADIPTFLFDGDTVAIEAKKGSMTLGYTSYMEGGFASWIAPKDLVLQYLISKADVTKTVALIDTATTATPSPSTYAYGTPDARNAKCYATVHMELQNWLSMSVERNYQIMSTPELTYVDDFFKSQAYSNAQKPGQFKVVMTSDHFDLTVLDQPEKIDPKPELFTTVKPWVMTKKNVYGIEEAPNAAFVQDLKKFGVTFDVDFETSPRLMAADPASTVTYLSGFNFTTRQTGKLEITAEGVKITPSLLDGEELPARVALGKAVNKVLNETLENNDEYKPDEVYKLVHFIESAAKYAMQSYLWGMGSAAYEFVFNASALGDGQAKAVSGKAVKVNIDALKTTPLHEVKIVMEGVDAASLTDMSKKSDFYFAAAPLVAMATPWGTRQRVMTPSAYGEELRNMIQRDSTSAKSYELPPVTIYTQQEEKGSLVDVAGKGSVRLTISVLPNSRRSVAKVQASIEDKQTLAGFEAAVGLKGDSTTQSFPELIALSELLMGVGLQTLMQESLKSTTALTMSPAALGNTVWKSDDAVPDKIEGFAKVEIPTRELKTDAPRGLKKGIVKFTKIKSKDEITKDSLNVDDFKAIQTAAVNKPGTGIVIADMTREALFPPAFLLETYLADNISLNTGAGVLYTVDVLEGDLEGAIRPAGVVKVKIDNGVIELTQEEALTVDGPVMYSPDATMAMASIMSKERDAGRGAVKGQMGYPEKINGKSMVAVSAGRILLRTIPTDYHNKTFIAKMKKNEYAASSYGKLALVQATYAENEPVISFQRKPDASLSILSLVPYKNASMKDDPVETRKSDAFSGPFLGYKGDMPLTTWTCTLDVLTAVMNSGTEGTVAADKPVKLVVQGTEKDVFFGLIHKDNHQSGITVSMKGGGGGKPSAASRVGAHFTALTTVFGLSAAFLISV